MIIILKPCAADLTEVGVKPKKKKIIDLTEADIGAAFFELKKGT
tara:strand:+ start:177 stop:308 length:132 start_codon:yes stop_codon:yes gene_type:complete